MHTTVFLQAALNGDCVHPAAPRTPTAIADAARAAVDAGAKSVHVHAFDDAGREILESGACAKMLRAILMWRPPSGGPFGHRYRRPWAAKNAQITSLALMFRDDTPFSPSENASCAPS